MAKLYPSSREKLRFSNELLERTIRTKRKYAHLGLDWLESDEIKRAMILVHACMQRYCKRDFQHSIEECQAEFTYGEFLIRQNQALQGQTGDEVFIPEFPRTREEILKWSVAGEDEARALRGGIII